MERLTKKYQYLLNEAKNLGVRITIINCKPQAWRNCGNNKFLKYTLVDRDDLLEFARTQKLRCVTKEPFLKLASESTLSTDYSKSAVTPCTKSGKRPFEKDSLVIDMSPSEKFAETKDRFSTSWKHSSIKRMEKPEKSK